MQFSSLNTSSNNNNYREQHYELQDTSLIDSLPSIPGFSSTTTTIQPSTMGISEISHNNRNQASLSTLSSEKSENLTSKNINIQRESKNSEKSKIDLNKSSNSTCNTIIMAIGSSLIQIGFLNQELPCKLIPAVIGRPKTSEKVLQNDEEEEEEFIGDEALSKKGILELSYPMENGKIWDWNDITKIWKFSVNSVLSNVNAPFEIILSIPEYLNRDDQDEIKRVFLNSFNISDISVILEPVSISNSLGKNSALIVDIGASGARISPVIEKQILSSCCTRFFFGGYHVDSFLSRLLQENGYNFTSSSEIQILKGIKEKYSYVATNYQNEIKLKLNQVITTFTMPDEQIVNLGIELFKCMEPFFNPSLIGIDEKGIHHQILITLMKCPVSSRRDLLSNIVIVGGTTKAKGFLPRFANELGKITPPGAAIKITAPPNRHVLSWIGANGR